MCGVGTHVALYAHALSIVFLTTCRCLNLRTMWGGYHKQNNSHRGHRTMSGHEGQPPRSVRASVGGLNFQGLCV